MKNKLPESAKLLPKPIRFEVNVYENGPVPVERRRNFYGRRTVQAIAYTEKMVYFADGTRAYQTSCWHGNNRLKGGELAKLAMSMQPVQTAGADTYSEDPHILRQKYLRGFGSNKEQVAAQTMSDGEFYDWYQEHGNEAQSFSYSSKFEPGKARTRMLRGHYVIYLDGENSHTSDYLYTYDDAMDKVAEYNDWQRLGRPGQEVYKGDATFNKAFKVQPFEHVLLSDNKIFFFVWDTRELTRVAKRPSVDVLPYLHIEKSDSHKPIAKNGRWLSRSELLAQPVNFKTDKQIREAANAHVSNEDMVDTTSDNTSLAPDVDSVGSGDSQAELIRTRLTDCHDIFEIYKLGNAYELRNVNGDKVDSASSVAALIKKHRLHAI